VGSAKRSSIHRLTDAAKGFSEGSVPVDEAQALIAQWIKPVAAIEKTALRECLGRVLGESVRSTVDVPPHDNSAMDGWAVRSTDLKCRSLPVLSFRSDLTRWLFKSKPNLIYQPAN
jgi:molybdopterin molybdotransferase